MKKNIQEILTDLYEFDPSLKSQENDLILIIEKILAKKPNTKFNKNFANKLRQELVGSKTFNFMDLMNNKFVYLTGGVVIASLVIIPTLSTFNNQSSVIDFSQDILPRITLLEDEAFGPLFGGEGVGSASGEVAKAPLPTSLATRDQSGGGGGGTTSMIFPAPDFMATNFNFIYKGEEIDLGEDKLEVLRSKNSQSLVGNLASRFGLGLVNLQKFNNLKFTHISMYDDGGDGFSVDVNPANGEISLSKNLPARYFMENEYRPIDISEVPADSEIFSITNQFITDYGISLEGYGEPIIYPGFSTQLELARDNPNDSYIPEYIDVIYPLKIRDTAVYDQGGSEQGVYVTINIRAKQVTSLRGLNIQQYDASAYKIESDINKLISSRQDQNNYTYPADVKVSTVDVSLGTPQLVYSAVFNYVNGQDQRLFVPSYLFPVLEKPIGNPYYPNHIIIPLVAEFNNNNQPITIMEDSVKSGEATPETLPVLPLR